jgi:hypothetical protein
LLGRCWPGLLGVEVRGSSWGWWLGSSRGGGALRRGVVGERGEGVRRWVARVLMLLSWLLELVCCWDSLVGSFLPGSLDLFGIFRRAGAPRLHASFSFSARPWAPWTLPVGPSRSLAVRAQPLGQLGLLSTRPYALPQAHLVRWHGARPHISGVGAPTEVHPFVAQLTPARPLHPARPSAAFLQTFTQDRVTVFEIYGGRSQRTELGARIPTRVTRASSPRRVGVTQLYPWGSVPRSLLSEPRQFGGQSYPPRQAVITLDTVPEVRVVTVLRPYVVWCAEDPRTCYSDLNCGCSISYYYERAPVYRYAPSFSWGRPGEPGGGWGQRK